MEAHTERVAGSVLSPVLELRPQFARRILSGGRAAERRGKGLGQTKASCPFHHAGPLAAAVGARPRLGVQRPLGREILPFLWRIRANRRHPQEPGQSAQLKGCVMSPQPVKLRTTAPPPAPATQERGLSLSGQGDPP